MKQGKNAIFLTWDTCLKTVCMNEKHLVKRHKTKPSLSFLIITFASGIVPIKVPPGRSKADTLAKARRARASVDQE